MRELVYGKSVCLNSFEANRKVYKVFMLDTLLSKETKILEYVNKLNVDLEVMTREAMNKKFKGNHQGIALEVEEYKYYDVFEVLDQVENPFVIILDGLEDPHNLGAILRTADATKVDLVIIPKNRSVSLNSTVAKVSAGAIEYVKVAQVSNINQTIDKLKKRGLWIYTTSLDATKYYNEESYLLPTAIVIGNEGKGVSSLVKKNSDVLIKIPMEGHVESLNASVSASILMYEVYGSRKI